MKKKDPTLHRIIEKRRRDRMNNCLSNLSKLIPSSYMRKGNGRVEKTEIIEMAIKHLRDLTEITSNTHREQQHPHQLAVPTNLDDAMTEKTRAVQSDAQNLIKSSLSSSVAAYQHHYASMSTLQPSIDNKSCSCLSLSSNDSLARFSQEPNRCQQQQQQATTNSCDIHVVPSSATIDSHRPILQHGLNNGIGSIDSARYSLSSSEAHSGSESSNGYTSNSSNSSETGISCCKCRAREASIESNFNIRGKRADGNKSNIIKNSIGRNNLMFATEAKSDNNVFTSSQDLQMRSKLDNCHEIDSLPSGSAVGWYKKAWLVRSFSQTFRDR